ncbi:unnamed protein product, partial [marine sediment metagenome]
ALVAAAAVVLATGCVLPGRVRYVADFYVAPNGDDAWSGRLATPNYAGSDGPFATVERARDALRQRSRPRYPSLGKFVVLIRGGTYYLAGPIVFQAEDSGSASAPIVYAAYPNESPVFTGGRPITGWTPGTGGVWTARVPDFVPPTRAEPARRRWYFHQLWVGDQRRARARIPNSGYLHTEGPLPQFAEPQKHRGDVEANLAFRYKAGNLRKWQNLDDANVVVYHA